MKLTHTRRGLTIAGATGLALLLAGCGPSDKDLAKKASLATKPSEVLVNVCAKTGPDLDRVKNIAKISNWDHVSGQPEGPKKGTWKTEISGKPVLVTAFQEKDTDKGSATEGVTVTGCAVSFGGGIEDGFEKTVAGELDLTQIAPIDFKRTEQHFDRRYSESGEEDGSLELLLGKQSVGFLQVMETALLVKAE